MPRIKPKKLLTGEALAKKQKIDLNNRKSLIHVAANPVFIHSLFRAGSSYFLDVFRRSQRGYWCYYEPFHESIFELARHSERMYDHSYEKQEFLRHPKTRRPYFFEYDIIKHDIISCFFKEFSYDTFFSVHGVATNRIAKYLHLLLK